MMKNKRAQHIKLDSYKVTDRFNLNKVKIITQQNQLKLSNNRKSRNLSETQLSKSKSLFYRNSNEISFNHLSVVKKNIFNPSSINLPYISNNVKTPRINRRSNINTLMSSTAFKNTHYKVQSNENNKMRRNSFIEFSFLDDIKFNNFNYSIFSFDNEFSPNEAISSFAYNTSQGNIRAYNEDAIQVTKLDNDINFFAIYDGHGGSSCANYLRDTLHCSLKVFSSFELAKAISEADEYFINTKAQNKAKSSIIDQSGSCAIIVCIKDRKCIFANVGDSKAFIVRNNKIYFSTKEHKPNKDKERKRIISNGGNVYFTPFASPIYQNGKAIHPPWRVYPGQLSVSRTIGDASAKLERFGGKKGVVISTPEITEIDIDDECNYIVMCCDGIFDVMSEDNIMQCVNEAKRRKSNKSSNIICAEAANIIIKCAMKRESFDNLSCIVIGLNIN